MGRRIKSSMVKKDWKFFWAIPGVERVTSLNPPQIIIMKIRKLKRWKNLKRFVQFVMLNIV